jgi:hypothetical protein
MTIARLGGMTQISTEAGEKHLREVSTELVELDRELTRITGAAGADTHRPATARASKLAMLVSPHSLFVFIVVCFRS